MMLMAGDGNVWGAIDSTWKAAHPKHKAIFKMNHGTSHPNVTLLLAPGGTFGSKTFPLKFNIRDLCMCLKELNF